jgi:lysophospholipase L1-like esterase
METRGIPINDLYGYALQKQREIQRESNVHFTPAGYKQLAKPVVDRIIRELQIS